MPDDPATVRRDVLRRVRYAVNLLALESDAVPPEGPFDAALTNGLLSIVSSEWPGEDVYKGSDKTKPASALLGVINAHGGMPEVDSYPLQEGLDLTQPFRHGRADDEFAQLGPDHLAALARLDAHFALRFADTARGLAVSDAVIAAYTERAEAELPWRPKDRLLVPEPELCDCCWRETFLPSGWDMFGGTSTGGYCLACGYERSEEDAYEQSISDAIDRRVNDGT